MSKNPVLDCFPAIPSKIVPYYTDKNVTLYNAKYQDILPNLNSDSVDLLLTDPPYATTQLAWDKKIDWNFFWKGLARICKVQSPMVLFASGKFVNELINSNPKNYRYELIWEKNLAVGFLDAKNRPLRAHENILIFTGKLFRGTTYNPQMIEGKWHERGKKKPKCAHYGGQKGQAPVVKTNLYYPKSILRFNNSRTKSLHPTQKPLDLMEWLVKTYSNRGDLILEPFAGSGSTIIAAARNGRQCIASEQSEEYCEIIARRLESGN